ncbi:delta-like protein 1 [Centruroides sculpturatus]|uniref:delta-like protein 1 n=1 Tax=Centruroides sculpturatus TaxID=218467 RepID=UPI000C6DA9EF|nr:delta-like protein 1 [Centruroides sculpturatus]
MTSLVVFLLSIFIHRVSSSGIVHLRLEELLNTRNNDVTGQCCHVNETEDECYEPCNIFLRICGTHVSRFQNLFNLHLRIDPNTPCSFGLVVTDVLPKEDPVKDTAINMTFEFPWPGKILFIIEAWHSPNGSDPVDGAVKDGRLIARFVNQHKSSPNNVWKTTNLTAENDASLEYSFKVACSPGYTGSKCVEKCPSSNDTEATFVCSPTGSKVCREGWTGKHCDRPICREGCQGYCTKPYDCVCRIGWRGDTCEECVPLPGCMHGSCDSTFQCNCISGWDGLFCSQPICKEGCHATRGYCEDPGECKCRIGWKGETCDECRKLPGCVHGYCEKPLDCICEEGWTSLFCHIPKCSQNCSKEHGYCTKPNECRCRVGWQGENCDQCFPYPGCQNGTCDKPWECNCLPGYSGPLCDRKIDYCELMNPCLNNGTCVNMADRDEYLCICPDEYHGQNCELHEKNEE